MNGPVVVRLTTSRFTGTVSTENRSSLVAYPRTQYVPPWDSVPHPEDCTLCIRDLIIKLPVIERELFRETLNPIP